MSTNLLARFTSLDILELRSMHITLDPEPFPIHDAERWVALREENDRLTTMLLEERRQTEQLAQAYEKLCVESAAVHRALRTQRKDNWKFFVLGFFGPLVMMMTVSALRWWMR